MSSRKYRGKTIIRSKPSSDDCDDDGHLLGLSINDIDDILVRLGGESLKSVEMLFSQSSKKKRVDDEIVNYSPVKK